MVTCRETTGELSELLVTIQKEENLTKKKRWYPLCPSVIPKSDTSILAALLNQIRVQDVSVTDIRISSLLCEV